MRPACATLRSSVIKWKSYHEGKYRKTSLMQTLHTTVSTTRVDVKQTFCDKNRTQTVAS